MSALFLACHAAAKVARTAHRGQSVARCRQSLSITNTFFFSSSLVFHVIVSHRTGVLLSILVLSHDQCWSCSVSTRYVSMHYHPPHRLAISGQSLPFIMHLGNDHHYNRNHSSLTMLCWTRHYSEFTVWTQACSSFFRQSILTLHALSVERTDRRVPETII